jgi:LPXTG-motif cell wall-anchored protein
VPTIHWGSFIAGALLAILAGYFLQRRRVGV